MSLTSVLPTPDSEVAAARLNACSLYVPKESRFEVISQIFKTLTINKFFLVEFEDTKVM